MKFDSATWWLATLLFGVIISAAGFFLKRTIDRTSIKTDEHDRDISHIKQTYVSKNELQQVRKELRDDVSCLAKDVKDIKDTALTKADFYRTQLATDQKIDKIYDLLINQSKGAD